MITLHDLQRLHALDRDVRNGLLSAVLTADQALQVVRKFRKIPHTLQRLHEAAERLPKTLERVNQTSDTIQQTQLPATLSTAADSVSRTVKYVGLGTAALAGVGALYVVTRPRSR